jgi:hypothetical protein
MYCPFLCVLLFYRWSGRLGGRGRLTAEFDGRDNAKSNERDQDDELRE